MWCLHYLLRKKYFFLLWFFFLPGSVTGSPVVSTPEVDVRLVSRQTALNGQHTITMGAVFDLKDHWKIYWRSPGDAGFPPSLRWDNSRNIDSVLWRWPAPTRFTEADLETIGYENKVIFPLEVRVTDPSVPLSARFTIDYLICRDICIPGQANLTAEIPPGHGQLSESATDIDDFLHQIPRESSPLQITNVTLKTDEDNQNPILSIVVKGMNALLTKTPDVFVEGDLPDNGYGLLSVGAPVVTSHDNVVTTLQVPLRHTLPPQAAVTVTLSAGTESLEITQKPDHTPIGPRPVTLLIMLGVAFLGGLILNAMPCVLPVLSLKVLHLIQHVNQPHSEVRRNFFGTACGIILTFVSLGVVLSLLRMSGQTLGWGFQFQQPLFLSILVLVLVLFSANLRGHVSFASLSLPTWLSELRGPTWAQPLVNGVFVTILATPCSAPLVGTAVGFALVQDPAIILGIFLMLGLGMATPYLAVAGLPKLGQCLPRPGPWMIHCKSVLALLLLATAGWLLWIIVAQNEVVAAVTLLLSLVTLGVLHVKSQHKIKAFLPIIAGAILISAGAFFVTQSDSFLKRLWIPFEDSKIPDMVDRGHTVFVDVTARWCLTCHVNKLTVLSRSPVLDLLQTPDVIAMQADWTEPDPRIASYLSRFQRHGIPFNVVYGPSCPTGIVLPELLSTQDTVTALYNASSPSGACTL